MRRITPQKLLKASMIVVFIVLVLPLYAFKGLNDSMDHARDTGTVGGIDFKAYYIAADMLRSGEDFYDVQQQVEQVQARGLPLNESFYIYPPLLAILFVPLTILPMQQAAQVWFFLNLALYALTMVIVSRAFRLSRLTGMLPLLWILAFLYPPALYTLYKGQVNIVILLLLAITYWLCIRGRQVLAGVALGVASMIKVIPLFLLPYALWRRRYTLGFTAAATIVIIAIVGLAIVGVGPHRTYLSAVLPLLAQPRPNPSNQSLGGFFSLLLVENPYAHNLTHNPPLWKALTLSASAVFVSAVIFMLWQCRERTHRTDLEFALIITTLPLITNIAWVDLFVLLIIPYAVLLKHAVQRQIRMRWMVLGAISALCVSVPRLQDLLTNLVAWPESLVRSPLTMGLPFFGLILLWVATAAALWQVPDQETPVAAE
jgi:uncharacterized membrane protein